jgi:hypothetical protein
VVISDKTGGGGLERWLPLSGVVFVVLTIVAIVGIGGDTPDSGASAARVASYYGDHHLRQSIAAFVLAASVPFLVFFGVYLATRFRVGVAGRSIWQLVLLAGVAVAAALWVVSAFVHFALADGADQGVSAAVLQGLNVLDSDSWIAYNSGLGVMMLGAAGTLMPASAGYRRLGWVAAVLGILLFIPFADFFGLLLTGIWIIVVSIMCSRKAAHTEARSIPETS